MWGSQACARHPSCVPACARSVSLVDKTGDALLLYLVVVKGHVAEGPMAAVARCKQGTAAWQAFQTSTMLQSTDGCAHVLPASLHLLTPKGFVKIVPHLRNPGSCTMPLLEVARLTGGVCTVTEAGGGACRGAQPYADWSDMTCMGGGPVAWVTLPLEAPEGLLGALTVALRAHALPAPLLERLSGVAAQLAQSLTHFKCRQDYMV